MPAVHLLHNHSGSKLLPTFYQGHSFQALSVLAAGNEAGRAVRVAAVFDDGIKFSNRDKRTKPDHGINLFLEMVEHFPGPSVLESYLERLRMLAMTR